MVPLEAPREKLRAYVGEERLSEEEAAEVAAVFEQMSGVWAEHARTVSGAMARKTVVISTTRLLLVPELLASAPDTFLALLQAAMAIVLTDQSFKGEIKDDDNAPGLSLIHISEPTRPY